jgi:hypothetical protein
VTAILIIAIVIIFNLINLSMKKYVFLAVIALLAASCSKETVNEVTNPEQHTAPVTVRVSNLSISQEDLPDGSTRAAQTIESYDNVGAIDLAFYAGETEVFKTTQLRSNPSTYTTFGEFSCNLPIGSYTMVVVGRGCGNDDVFVLTSPTAASYTSERARETFCATQSVTVTAAGADVSVTMNRIIALLNIRSTDAASEGMATIRTTYAAGGKSFNPTTGLATSNAGFLVTNSRHVVDGKLNVGSYVFLATDEQTMTITIEALDAGNNVLLTKVVPNVPLKRNRKTILSGALFTTSASTTAFQVETSWLEDNTVNI